MNESWYRPRQVIAHRGSRLLWPENTMLAFESAVAHGIELIETDIRLSSDGILHCFHDSSLERTTDGQGAFADRSAAELAKLNAGYRHDPYKNFPFRAAGATTPRFESVLDAFPGLGFVVDLKAPATDQALADLINRRPDLGDRLIVGSFTSARLEGFRTLTSESVATSTGAQETVLVLAAAWTRRSRNPFGLATRALQVPVSWYGVPVVSPKLIELAHRFDRLVHVWTINEPNEMQRLWEMGVDAIITDRPDLAVVAR